MSLTTTPVVVPGYRTGVWNIDPAHSDVSFTVRHMMVSKVRGSFREFSGQIVTAVDPDQSSVTAEVNLASIDTNNAQRDEHIRSADFFDVANHPIMSFRSTGVRTHGDHWIVSGDLSLHGVTRPVDLDLEANGFGPDAFGGYRAGFSATTQISRSDYGINIAMPMDGGGVVVSDKVTVALEIEAVLDEAS